MFKLKPGDDVGPFEVWAMDNAASDYKTTRGVPITSGRVDVGGVGCDTRYGIWRCTEGALDCTEQGDELFMVLAGRCRLIDHATGEVVALAAGDSYFVCDGARVTWDVIEDLTKVFFGCKPSGY